MVDHFLIGLLHYLMKSNIDFAEAIKTVVPEVDLTPKGNAAAYVVVSQKLYKVDFINNALIPTDVTDISQAQEDENISVFSDDIKTGVKTFFIFSKNYIPKDLFPLSVKKNLAAGQALTKDEEIKFYIFS